MPYAAAAESEDTWVAEWSGRALGVMVLYDLGFAALDIHLIAVHPDVQRRGVGRALIGAALLEGPLRGKAYLSVKTIGPSSSDEPYRRTRLFYESLGFEALVELRDIWGPENPCLIMVKRFST